MCCKLDAVDTKGSEGLRQLRKTQLRRADAISSLAKENAKGSA